VPFQGSVVRMMVGCGIIEEMKNSENPILLLQLISLNGQWNEMCVIDNITRRNGTQL
jgi:hypothetical protein